MLIVLKISCSNKKIRKYAIVTDISMSVTLTCYVKSTLWRLNNIFITMASSCYKSNPFASSIKSANFTVQHILSAFHRGNDLVLFVGHN